MWILELLMKIDDESVWELLTRSSEPLATLATELRPENPEDAWSRCAFKFATLSCELQKAWALGP